MNEKIRRDIPPQEKTFEKFHLPAPELAGTPEGIPIYIVPGEKHEVSRIDILFKRGTYDQTQPLQASATSVITSEATRRFSSSKMSRVIDYYGGWMQRIVYMHATLFSMYVPKRNFSSLMPVFAEIFENPRFSSRDLSLYKVRGTAEYKQLYEQVEFLSARQLKKCLYTSHPYGTTSEISDFGKLAMPIIKAYNEKYYTRNECTVILSGNIDDKIINQTINAVSRIPAATIPETENDAVTPPHSTPGAISHVEKDDALQSSVRTGSILKQASEEDIHKLEAVNTILGGYFGSRLMTNIREEKGYTYGITSRITPLRHATSMSISAQCDLKYTCPLIKEVFAEIEKMRNTPVTDEEIKSAKRYILGEMIRIFDNRFTLADTYLSMLINGYPFNYYNQKAEAVETITPEQIMQTAQKYIQPEDMHTVVAGGNKKFGETVKRAIAK